ncbi:MAG: response regulator [Myxococcaceae bacterium]
MSTDRGEGLEEVELEQPEDRLRREEVRRIVLLVEDEPQAREALAEVLELWGYQVIAVGSAEEAEYAVKRSRPDAALIDVYLPGRTGAALMSKLREKFPDVVLIGMSGLGDAEMARTVKGVGADLFIGKPVSMDALAEALKASHRTWH